MAAEWVQLKDYPRYAVHRDGHIKNLDSGCVLAGHINKQGYREVCLVTAPGTKHSEFVHQLIMVTFVGECPVGYSVDHKDRNRANAKLDNLQYVTVFVNSSQAASNKNRFGEGSSLSKLTEKEVKDIRFQGAMGISSRELGKRFKVDRSMISYIIARKNWTHI